MVKDFCERLIELRNEKGLSQKEVAVSCQTTQETVSRWESGVQEPKISYLICLSKLFDVSADYLLGLEN